MLLNTSVDPVKWMPANSWCEKITSEAVGPEQYTRLITPSGSPASCNIFIMT